MKDHDEMKDHPASASLPLMVGVEFDELVLDIKAHGLREPIALHPDGSVLDGRNRLRACTRAGVEPHFKTWDGRLGTEAEYIMSMNLHRRHLDESQRAMIAARMANLKSGQHKPGAVPMGTASAGGQGGSPVGLIAAPAASLAKAGKMLNVGRRSVARARKVLASGQPALIEAVDRGEIAVRQAADMVEAPKPTRRTPTKTAKLEAGLAKHRERLKYWRTLSDALCAIVTLPAQADIIRVIPPTGRESLNRKLPVAIRWLNDFQQEWNKHERSHERSENHRRS